MDSPLASWKQTRVNTCGPASLMTALHELGRCELSESMEWEIWTRVRYCRVLGSTPGRLAEQARVFGAKSFLHVCQKPRNPETPKPFKILYLLHRRLMHAYRASALEARGRGVPLAHHKSRAQLLRHVLREDGARAILLILDDDAYFHFVLARKTPEGVAVMDPYPGVNTAHPLEDYVAAFEKALLGYAVVVR